MIRTIDKTQYFQISHQCQVSNRRPILMHCERRAYTRYLAMQDFSLDFEQFKKKELKEGGLKRPVVPQIGESASYAGGTNNWIMSRICPEVSLFEPEILPFDTRDIAATSLSYDKYFTSDTKTEVHDTGHFSQCMEYISYAADKDSPKSNLIEIKPTWYGIKIDLHAIFRKLFKRGR